MKNLTNFSAPHAIFLKKQAKKSVLSPFLEISAKTLVYFGTEFAFRKILVSVSQKLISQNSTKGAFGSAGGRIPEGGGRGEASPLNKSAGDRRCKKKRLLLYQGQALNVPSAQESKNKKFFG